MTVKDYVCLRCSYNFRYVRMVEYCPNCGTRGFINLQHGFKMNKQKAMKLIGKIERQFNCNIDSYNDELAKELHELRKWIDYNIK